MSQYRIIKILLLLVCGVIINNIAFSQQIPDHRSSDYIPQSRNQSLFPLSSSDSTGKWIQLHPTIPRVDYWGVYFIDADTGFAVGDGGAIIKTTDGGQVWRSIESGVTTLLRTIGSFDGEVIVAAGDLGRMIISTDYGESWQNLPNVVPHNLWNIQFVTKQIGWLVGVGSSALKTTDGGNTWINQQTPLSGYPFWDVSFYDTSFGYMCTNLGLVLRTTDGGSTWDIRETVNQHHLYTIKAITREKAVSFGGEGKHAYTDNGGESWQFLNFYASLDPYQITFLDTLRGIVVGFGGALLTTDGGWSWVYGGGIIEGHNITFVDDNIGFLVASSMVLNKSTNSGQSWFSTINNDHFTDVFFTSDKVGWFIGRYIYAPVWTTLYKTTDGGRTLTPQSNIPGSKPSSVYFIDSLTGIVGAENAIFKTTDGGGTWIERPINNLPGNGGVYDRLFFVDENTGWAKSTYVIKTTDAGESWNFQIHAGILSLHFYDPLNGWAVRGSAKPLKTSDGGETWIEQTHISFSDSYLDVFFKDNLNGFILTGNYIPPGGEGRIFKTNSGGGNWTVADSSVVNFGFGKFSNVFNNEIFITGSGTLWGYKIYKSSNLGESWDEVIELRNTDVRYIRQSQFQEKFNIAIGNLALVLRFTDSLIVSIGESPITIAERFYIEQNYPNPFNAETVIQFTLPIPGHVKIYIYDITGRLVKELLNEELNAGGHKVKFNAERMSSGIYYYKLETENFSQTRKMVLLK